MRILSRYLLKEIAVPLAAWLGFLFLLLFVMSFLRGTDVLLGSAVTAYDVGKLTLLLAPHFLQQALPVAFLLGILLGIGRLAEDAELTAMNAVGVTPWQILVGPLVLGGILSMLMLGIAYTLEPYGLRAVKEAANEVIKRNLAGDVRAGVFYEDLTDLTLYAEGVDEREGRWSHVLVHDGRDRASPLLVLARNGRVHATGSGEALRIALEQGQVHRANRSTDEYAVVEFERGDIVIGVGESFFFKNHFQRPKEELTPGELLQAASEAQSKGENGRPFLMTRHWRFGQALMPLAFAMMGVPLAMSRRQSGRARGYLLTLFGYIGYYVLARVCATLGERGQLPLVVGGQLPNVVFALLGLAALWRIGREGSIRGSA